MVAEVSYMHFIFCKIFLNDLKLTAFTKDILNSHSLVVLFVFYFLLDHSKLSSHHLRFELKYKAFELFSFFDNYPSI